MGSGLWKLGRIVDRQGWTSYLTNAEEGIKRRRANDIRCRKMSFSVVTQEPEENDVANNNASRNVDIPDTLDNPSDAFTEL
ncbi:hypothetical protein GJ496_009699 [Pomphorhynchus laevis]|nr:hypothetical protein GJ496_009699 [Pomphorhynchus laevis]